MVPWRKRDMAKYDGWADDDPRWAEYDKAEHEVARMMGRAGLSPEERLLIWVFAQDDDALAQPHEAERMALHLLVTRRNGVPGSQRRETA